ncbi:MAG TPA: acetyl-CoA C-acyltransferase FadI [Acidimicrobiia bacterium]|nr:acetyl-CoA C-acyltransferase FadI [Acidimicrobiia bacterium]
MVEARPGVVNGRRVAIVDGLRTPFAKSGTDLRSVSTLGMASILVAELLARSGLDPAVVDRVVYGSVVQDLASPNIAREIVLATALPDDTDAYSVTRACATSTQSFVDGAQAILLGDADVVLTGGADSLSKPPVTFSDEFVEVMMRAQAARDLPTRLKAFTRLRPKDLTPNPPAIADRSTGETMGESAEKMARLNGIGREAQDAYAVESHRKAVEAWDKGVYDDEVMPFPLPPDYSRTVERDTIPRFDTSLEKLGKLKPVFDRRYGTITAGNASPLTDGASALILMEEQTARRLGLEPKAFLRSYAFAAVDPHWQLLMGPAISTPIALDRAGLALDDIDVIDIHEAFAAQVLSVTQAFASADFARQRLGRDRPVGDVPAEKLNLYGGSISLGHPFAATGARQLLTMANELVRRDSGTALITQCAAGGLGATVILERA